MAAQLTTASLRRGVRELAARDADVARALDCAGMPALRRVETGFPALMRAIVGQQVSTHAARAIWERVCLRCDPMTPERLLRLRRTTLRKVGLSRQKAEYVRSLASHIADGRLDLDALAEMAEEDAIAAMTNVKGIGRWSAEIYLLFALGRRDIWPVDDLALAKAVVELKGLGPKPGRTALIAAAEPWRPWRGAAAHLMWHYYHWLHRREGGGV